MEPTAHKTWIMAAWVGLVGVLAGALFAFAGQYALRRIEKQDRPLRCAPAGAVHLHHRLVRRLPESNLGGAQTGGKRCGEQVGSGGVPARGSPSPDLVPRVGPRGA